MSDRQQYEILFLDSYIGFIYRPLLNPVGVETTSLCTIMDLIILLSLPLNSLHLGRHCMISKINKEKDVRKKLNLERWWNHVSRKGKKYSTYKQPKKSQKRKENFFIKFPSELDIYSPEKPSVFSLAMNSIFEIRNQFHISSNRIYLDFTNTKSMKMATLLILYASVEASLKRGVSYKILYSTKYQVNELLRNSGLVALCKGEIASPKFEGVNSLPIISGIGGAFRDEIIDFIQKEIYKNKMKPETEHTYADAVQEAINNVGLHAYPHKQSEDKKWWLACHVIHEQLYLAIYDEGVGIPGTVMEKKWFFSTLKSTYPHIKLAVKNEAKNLNLGYKQRSEISIGIVSDAMKIAISMIGDITGTAHDKHGQGSKSIQALVLNNKHGKLWIYSNLGLFTLSKTEGRKINDLSRKVPGTLIQWNIKVSHEE
ncbi:ATP-binding protein [Dickeya zeae]|uniref:ATP-binding protein n=1 Tax=Dickeya zeae TaxID=204042 RepID=UPI00126944B1|nr:ATP-binding protein [Dickeya zeae]